MWLCENCVCAEEGLSVRRNVCGCKDGRLCLRFVQQVTILCLQNQQFTSEKTQHSAVFKEVLNIRFVLLPFFGLANKIFLQQENYYFSAFSPLEESQSFHPLAEWLAFRGGEVQESGRGGRDHRLSGVGRYRRQGEEVGTTAFGIPKGVMFCISGAPLSSVAVQNIYSVSAGFFSCWIKQVLKSSI